MECPRCGKIIPNEEKVCPFCLYQLNKVNLIDDKTLLQNTKRSKVPHRKDLNNSQRVKKKRETRLFSQTKIDVQSKNKQIVENNKNISGTSPKIFNNFQQFTDSDQVDTKSDNKKALRQQAKVNTSRYSKDKKSKSKQLGQKSKFWRYFTRIILIVASLLIVLLLAFLIIHFVMKLTIGGQVIKTNQFGQVQVTFSSTDNEAKSLKKPRQLTMNLTNLPAVKIPLKNIELKSNGKKIKFNSNVNTIANNNGQFTIKGKISHLQKFENNFNIEIFSDQKKKIFQSGKTKINFPIVLSGSYWQVVYKSDVNSPERTLKLFFNSDQSYQQNLNIDQTHFADSKKQFQWWQKAAQGVLQPAISNDGSKRFLTNPQQMVETEFLSNYQKGKAPVTRFAYDKKNLPSNLSDYQLEIREKDNQLYFFLPGTSPQGKTQIFLFEQIKANDFKKFDQIASLPKIKQKGMLSQPQIAIITRRKILTNFVEQLPYDLPLKDKSHLDTVFIDNPNGQQTTGLITYFTNGKVVNLMKFILYRNGRLSVYPLSSSFDVPKAYTLNLYHAIKNNNYESFPDFKK